MLDLEADTSHDVHRKSAADTFRAAPPSSPACTAPLLQVVLDGLPQAVAVLDTPGRLVFWNACARTRLTAAGWTLADQRLRAPGAADRDTLSRALPSVCERGRRQLLPLSFTGRPAHAALAPINVQGQCWAMLLLDRETLCGSIELQLFASNSGLTPTESRVLARLIDGQRPAQIAREHGVSLTTVQSQVTALRSKTRTSSVINLLANVARLPALRGLHLGPRP
jgi:DNA-binding CsgD family transcriptional regulator